MCNGKIMDKLNDNKRKYENIEFQQKRYWMIMTLEWKQAPENFRCTTSSSKPGKK